MVSRELVLTAGLCTSQSSKDLSLDVFNFIGDGKLFRNMKIICSVLICRVKLGQCPPDMQPCPSRQSALERAIRGYAEKLGDEVIDLCLGTTFDPLNEAYDFYNLYSWEHGFGIRYGKCRRNSEKTKCMQEIVCGCSGKPKGENTKSCRCECPAMIRHARDEDESYEEKQTKLEGIVLQYNVEIERYASKIYTRAMFAQFGKMLYRGFAYRVEEIEKSRTYKAMHTNAATREKWSRVEFEVKVIGDKEEFVCECGLFEHMGMLCGHALKVMDYVGVTRIPDMHILKRWTRDARDMLPDHLRHYQRDQPKGKQVTYRHCSLYILAMELVRLGDCSAEAYEKAVGLFRENLVALAPYENARDGLGLEDRVAGQVRKRSEAVDAFSADEAEANGNALVGLGAPSKKVKAGRPSTSREKAPRGDGEKIKILQHLICKKAGHKKTTCPDRGDEPKQPRKEGICSRCGLTGHRKSACRKPLGAPEFG